MNNFIWVEHGRRAEVLISFFEQLSEETKAGIKAVSIDIGQTYQSAVRKMLPHTDIVFDRFHVMQNYCILIKKRERKLLGTANTMRKECSKTG